jgi:hypothetical protein
MKRAIGQGLSDYSLVIGLVSLVAIGGLMSLGGWLNNSLNGMVRTTVPTPPAPVVASASSGSQGISAVPPPAAPFPTLPAQSATLLIDGNLPLAITYNNPAQVAETAGGNGVTENALGVIDQIAAQYKNMPEKQQTLAMLQALSEAGHRIKNTQREIQRLRQLQQGMSRSGVSALQSQITNMELSLLPPEALRNTDQNLLRANELGAKYSVANRAM